MARKRKGPRPPPPAAPPAAPPPAAPPAAPPPAAPPAPSARKRKGKPRPPPPAPPPMSEEHRLVCQLGNGGIISVLFESPSGFAIFKYDGVQLFLPNAVENIWANFVNFELAEETIWLKEFMTFKNKADVISPTGVNEELAAMIQRCQEPGQLLAVEKKEHKETIEAKLGIKCICDNAVLEVMWGIKNLMKKLLPLEDAELSKEDCLYMSHGMKTVLIRHGFNDVTPEMVTKQMIEYACLLYDTDLCETTKHSEFLTSCGKCLKERSGIECEGWSTMKLATALKILCFPNDDESYDNLKFSTDELDKLRNDGSEYDGILLKRTCMTVYNEMVFAGRVKADVEVKLGLLIAGVKKMQDCEAEVKQEVAESSKLP